MSTLAERLVKEIESAPEPVQQALFDFLLFLKTRERARREGLEDLLPLAHSAWAADWGNPAEDEAWRDL